MTIPASESGNRTAGDHGFAVADDLHDRVKEVAIISFIATALIVIEIVVAVILILVRPVEARGFVLDANGNVTFAVMSK